MDIDKNITCLVQLLYQYAHKKIFYQVVNFLALKVKLPIRLQRVSKHAALYFLSHAALNSV